MCGCEIIKGLNAKFMYINDVCKVDFGVISYVITKAGHVYSISNRYKSITRRIKPIVRNGYMAFTLRTAHKAWTIYIHRLVALCFIPNPNKLPQINHINEDKADNRVENLEWCTAKYNYNYGTARERSRLKQINGANSLVVIQKDVYGNILKVWPSTAEAGRNGFSSSGVSSCCRGKCKCGTYKGYIWEYF